MNSPFVLIAFITALLLQVLIIRYAVKSNEIVWLLGRILDELKKLNSKVKS